MKKVFLPLMLIISFNSTAACTITSLSTDTKTTEIINANGYNLKNYDKTCRDLKSNNAGLLIAASGVVLGGQSIGWADVSLIDLDTDIVSVSYGGVTTRTNSFASQDKADELQMQAINSAIDNIDIDKAIISLRKKLKAAK